MNYNNKLYLVRNKVERMLSKIGKILLICLLIGGPGVQTAAAQLKLRGQVIDAESELPLSGATLTLLNTGEATASDSEGHFEFYIDQQKLPANTFLQIQIRALGYRQQEILWKAGQSDLLIHLQKASLTLDEVVISRTIRYTNRDNPAVELIRKVIEKRNENRISAIPYLQFSAYEKIMMAVSDLPDAVAKNPLFRNYQFIFENVDTTLSPGRKLLPLYMEEKLSKEFRRKQSPSKKTIIEDVVKTELDKRFVNNQNIRAVVSYLHHEIDLYDNSLVLFNRPFMSPVATGAPLFYKYAILDTLEQPDGQYIQVGFVPRNEEERLFSGRLLISTDGQFAIRSAEINLDQKANINWINYLQIQFEYLKHASGSYLPASIISKINFGIYGSSQGMFSHWVQRFEDYQLESLSPALFAGQAIAFSDSTDRGPNSYREMQRPLALSKVEERVYQNIDSLKENRSFLKTLDWLHFFTRGYKYAGPVEFGPLEQVYSYNNLEGSRVRVGGRTSAGFSQRFYGEAYSAYGFGDRTFKYYALAAFSLNNKRIAEYPAHYFSLSYQRDAREPGHRMAFLNGDDLLRSFRRSDQDFWLYHSLAKAEYVVEFGHHLRLHSGFSVHRQEAAGQLQFQRVIDGVKQQAMQTTELAAELRWAPNEEYFQTNLTRRTISSPYPIVHLRYQAGIKDLFGGEHHYHALRLEIQKRFYMSLLGFSDFSLGTGYIAGTVPFLLLDIPKADQSYLVTPDAYSLMRDLEFVSDQYIKFDFQHRFQGFFINKIPFLNKTKIREVAGVKMYYGNLRNENNPLHNKELFAFPTNEDGQQSTFAFGNKPYLEASVGLENIFKFLRVEYVRRLSYLDLPGARKDGLRFSIKVGF